MPRAKTARTTSLEAPAKPAKFSTVEHSNGKPPAELESVIRARAYELYEKRGRQDGFAQQDWLQAEAEVLSQSERRSA
jgi:Protein of unknown function (DUF2934)